MIEINEQTTTKVEYPHFSEFNQIVDIEQISSLNVTGSTSQLPTTYRSWETSYQVS